MKNLKTFSKRIKVTRNGKLICRKAGQNHFNSKASGAKRMGKRRPVEISMTKKTANQFLSHR